MRFLDAQNYQPQARKLFEEIKQALKLAFPESTVEHIGSSSIEGLISKGDLDIFLGVSPEKHNETVGKLEGMGYVVKQDTHRDKNLCMMILPDQNIDTAIQVVAKGSSFENFLTFKSKLQASAELREQYNQLKRDSISLSEDDYRLKKATFINNVLMDLEIRRAQPGDEAAIHEAHMRSIREVCVKDHGEEEIKGWGYRELGDRWIRPIREDSICFIWVVEFKSKVCGFGYIRMVQDSSPKQAHLHGLYLTPESIGHGIATRMMDLMLGAAKKFGASTITLESSKTAHGFYKRFGFKEVGPMIKVDIGGYPVSCFPMELELSTIKSI